MSEEILVAGSRSVRHHQPAVSHVLDRNFVVVWTADEQVHGQVFGIDGIASGSVFRVTPDRSSGHRPAVAGTTSGFVVAWTDPSARQVLIRRFAAHGSPFGAAVGVSTTDVDDDQRPAVATLTTGDLVVAWVDAHPERGVRARVLRRDGTSLSDEIAVSTSDVRAASLGLTQLGDAGFVIGWESSVEGRLHYRLFHPDGSPSSAQLTANVAFHGGPAVGSTQVPGDEPGHFVLAYLTHTGPDNEERPILANVMRPDGSPRSAAVAVTHLDDQTIGSRPVVRGLPGSRFVVAWTERKVAHVGDVSGTNVAARLFSPDVGALAGPIAVNLSRAGDQFDAAVAVVAGERGEFVVLAWTDHADPAASGTAVRARVLPGAAGLS